MMSCRSRKSFHEADRVLCAMGRFAAIAIVPNNTDYSYVGESETVVCVSPTAAIVLVYQLLRSPPEKCLGLVFLCQITGAGRWKRISLHPKVR